MRQPRNPVRSTPQKKPFPTRKNPLDSGRRHPFGPVECRPKYTCLYLEIDHGRKAYGSNEILNHEQLTWTILFHRAGGKVHLQPRIGCWLSDKEFAGQPLPSPHRHVPGRDLSRAGLLEPASITGPACRRPKTARPHQRAQMNATDREVVTDTPVGTQRPSSVTIPTTESPRDDQVAGLGRE
jgi:hypothetical protein